MLLRVTCLEVAESTGRRVTIMEPAGARSGKATPDEIFTSQGFGPAGSGCVRTSNVNGDADASGDSCIRHVGRKDCSGNAWSIDVVHSTQEISHLSGCAFNNFRVFHPICRARPSSGVAVEVERARGA